MKKMKTIFFFFWNLIMGIKRVHIKQLHKETTCPVLIYSIEELMIRKQTAAILPSRRNQHFIKLQQPLPMQKDPQNNPRAEWQIWCENNKMLFQSSA
jgi:hypothetical protein